MKGIIFGLYRDQSAVVSQPKSLADLLTCDLLTL